jgi:DNA-binding transcriptional MerR regulator
MRAFSWGNAMQSEMTTMPTNERDVRDAFSIREVARLFNVTLRALRFYEDRGLIKPIREGSARYYDAAMRSRLQLILKGKHLGFTLSEIRDMIAAQAHSLSPNELTLGQEQVVAQIELLQRQRDGIEDAIIELRATHERLSLQGAAPVTIGRAHEPMSARA